MQDPTIRKEFIVCVLLVIQLPNIKGGCFIGFQSGKWQSVHIDDINQEDNRRDLKRICQLTYAELLEQSHRRPFQENALLDTVQVIKNSLCISQTKIKDLDTMPWHGLKRFNHLMDLILPKTRVHITPDTLTFADGIVNVLLSLQKQKENEMVKVMGQAPKIAREACDPVNVRRAGTFRRSVARCIETRFAVVLTYVIAYMDTNQNLDLLTRSTSQDDGTTWADIFFLKVLNNSQCLILNYKNLLTSEGKESSLFYVGYTGYQDRPFQAQMPFSWILFEHIDKVYRRLADDKQVFTSEVAKVVATLSIMKDLEDSVTSEEERREACRLYLHDFICMTCQCDTDNVRQILETTFHQARKETGHSIDAPNLSLNLVNIHHIKSIVCKRLESFQMLRKTWLECDTYVEGQLQKTGNEVMCDVLALQGVVKDISTTCSSRNKNRWMSRIDAATPQISTMLKTDGNIRYGRQCVELLASIRNEWNRVLALKMFHEEVIVKSETQIDLNMKKVFKSLSKCSLRDVQGLIVIEEFIKAFQKTIPVTDRQLMEHFGRCLDNFYMRVVSQLCFADNSPPSDAVIDKLLTHMTSGISETGVDVVRTFSTGTGKETIAKSFFLQLLLRTRGDLVKRHIESFFGKTRTCFMNQIKGMVSLKSKQTTRLLEFCSMVVKCIEDSYTSQLSEHSQSFTHYVTEARKKLTWASQQTFKPGLHYSNLEIIANKQFGLKMTSTILQKCFVAKTEEVSEDIMALLSVTKGVCKEGGSDYPHKYLIRNVCDRYGISSYQCLTKSLTSLEGDFSWFPLYYNADENPECEHRYLVCGPDYLKARNQIKTMILRLLQNQDAASPYPGVEGKMQNIYLALAVHREVTFSYLQRTGLHQSGIPRMIREIFKRTNLAQTIKTHIADLVSNETGKSMTYLNIREGLDLHHQGIICLLEHLYVLCLVFKDSNSFISPLIQIVLEPESMLLSYFPTMPQEVDYKQMLAEIQRADPSATFNVCPNGHPYIIADCGRPWYTTNCPECGETIGGKHHRFEGSNKKLTESDLEKDPSIDQGHVLGDPSLSSSSRAVRNLTPVTSSMLRLFTHAALLLGAEKYPQHVLRMIKPSLVSGELQTFLVGHLKNDLDHLHKGLDRSHDDVLLLCHYALDVISQGCITGSLRSSKKTLRSPEARTTWENNIQSSVFCRITKDLTGILQRCREDMKGEDEASGTSLELKALLEQDFRIDNNACLENVQESCILWKRHARISVEGFIADVLSNRMSGKQDSRTLLEHFISKLEKIELVKYLPDILDLQRTLLNRFKRRMDKRDAKTMNIRQFLEEMKARFYLEENYMNGIKKQIDLCSEVWEKMSEYLKDYGLVVNKKGYTIKRIVPASIRMSPITYESPVEVLFPSFDGLGLCAFVLVEFLIRTQNELLQEYCRISKFRYEEIPLVSPKDITYSNVITVDKNVHFLPLLLSNCKYEVDAEQGQSFEYDKEGIERQVKDQFISGRSRIDIKNIPTMMYRSETAETWSYRRLTEVVPQAPMTGALKDLILADLRTIPQLYQAIDNLDMTISLLCCLPEQTDNPEQSLFKFMTKTLRMPNTELGQEVERSCKFKHVLSLWLVLSMKKDFFLHQNNQETFPCLEMKYKTAKLDRKKKAKYECFLNTLTKAQQRQLTEALYECIVIRFPNDETDDEQLDYSNMRHFYEQRAVLIQGIQNLGLPDNHNHLNIETLLYGCKLCNNDINKDILQCVIEYIRHTKRFDF
ncbi:E3 ubiquitin-protein ligase rnf213-alpha-like isoform X2 [Argopecten irradians]|uniref:E3 ubiquitin-protein ligase rnf213-alpha-like isoform X2 n=1 Tax=Argopecten irradians TaxID=31199 RepID=UPI00371D51C9